MKNGFTLIELIIVITIVTVLSVGGMSVYRTVFINSRDQQRIRDLQTFRQSLELYRSNQHYYPSDILSNPTNFNPATSDLKFNNKVYLIVPNDPSGSGSEKKYGYRALPRDCDNISSFCTSYVICSQTEGGITYGQGSSKVYSCSSLMPIGVMVPYCGNKDCDMGISSD